MWLILAILRSAILGGPGGIIFWTGLRVRVGSDICGRQEKNVQMPHSAASG